MLGLRYAALVALVVWIGGLVALGGIAAPVVFDVTAARHAAEPRLLAGALFGEMLARFYYVTYGAGLVLAASLGTRRILGPKPRRFNWRVGILLLMLAATAYGGVVVAGRIARLQAEIGVAPSSLPDNDPRRLEFGRLHGLSTGLQLVPLLGGLALLFWELKD